MRQWSQSQHIEVQPEYNLEFGGKFSKLKVCQLTTSRFLFQRMGDRI